MYDVYSISSMAGVYTSILALLFVVYSRSGAEIGIRKVGFHIQGLCLGILVHSGHNKHSKRKEEQVLQSKVKNHKYKIEIYSKKYVQ